ncbi:MAG: terminase large subunit domain-containing protein [Opitutaceae bacterium]
MSAKTTGAFSGRAKIRPARNTLLLGYQSRWVKDDSRLKGMEKARQIGMSWSSAYRVVTKKSLVDAQLDAWISSRDDLQARLFLEDCKKFSAIVQAGARDLGESVVDDKGHTAYVLQFSNGLRAHSMSSNPDAQAGKRGDRLLDEFALHPDPRKLWAIAYPGITWGGSLEFISTHRGSDNFFNELVQEVKHKGNPKGISLHTVTLQDALDEGFLVKLQQKLPADDERVQMDEAEYFDFIRAGCADEESFLQEFMCQPADDKAAFLSYDLIASCEYKEEAWEHDLSDAKGQLFVGVDVGRDHDLTVIWVVEKLGDVSFTRRLIEMKAQTFDAQEHALYQILALPQVRRCCIDCTGIGRQFSERAQQRFGSYRVEPVSFTGPVKEELAYPLRAAFEDKTVRIPNRNEIRADLRAIKKETTAAGNIRFTADRGKNGHADRFWALALALHAGKNATAPTAPRAFPRQTSRAIDRRERSVLA